MAGYQFVRIETYSRKAQSARRSISQIAAELARQDGATPHVEQPEAPRVLAGHDPAEVPGIVDERAREQRRALKRTGTSGPRKDTHLIEGAVASHPTPVAALDDPDALAAYEAWRDDAVRWLCEDMRARGVEVLSVVEHRDESHPHVHVVGMPTAEATARLDAKQTHPGEVAAAQAKADGERPGVAYSEAMRHWQDTFWHGVSMDYGHSRNGPGRRRLTRRQWRQEQAQAEAVATAKAEAGRITHDAEQRAQRIEAMAQAMADAQLAEAAAAAAMADDVLVDAQKKRDAAERQHEAANADRAAANLDRGFAEISRIAADNSRRFVAIEREQANYQRQCAEKCRLDADREREAAAEQRRQADRERQDAQNAQARAHALETGVHAWMDGRITDARRNDQGGQVIEYCDRATCDEIEPQIKPARERVWRWIKETADKMKKKIDAITKRESDVAKREQDMQQLEYKVENYKKYIEKRENTVEQREKELANRKAFVVNREINVHKRERDVRASSRPSPEKRQEVLNRFWESWNSETRSRSQQNETTCNTQHRLQVEDPRLARIKQMQSTRENTDDAGAEDTPDADPSGPGF